MELQDTSQPCTYWRGYLIFDPKFLIPHSLCKALVSKKRIAPAAGG